MGLKFNTNFSTTKETFAADFRTSSEVNGASAYEIAVKNGYDGTEEEWIESLKGEQGIQGIQGEQGPSAYEVAVENGFEGTEAEWIESLFGTIVQTTGDSETAVMSQAAVTDEFDKRFARAIVCPPEIELVSFDTVTRQLYIPNILYIVNGIWKEVGSSSIVDLSNLTSSDTHIFIDIVNNSFHAVPYYAVSTLSSNDYAYFCSVRSVRSRRIGGYCTINLPFPYLVDGKMFGVLPADSVNERALCVGDSEIDLTDYRLVNATLDEGISTTTDRRCATKDFIFIGNATSLTVSVTDGYKYGIHYYKEKDESSFIGGFANWQTETREIIFPDGANYFRIVMALVSDEIIGTDVSYVTVIRHGFDFSKVNKAVDDMLESLDLELPYVSEFSLEPGTAHSSLKDQISVTCKKGQKYFVTVETSTDNCGNIYLFEYLGGVNPTGTHQYYVTPNVEKEFIATTDFDGLGVYVIGNTEYCTYNFRCDTEDTVSSRRIADLYSKYENLGKDLPDYWIEHIEEKIPLINNNTSSCALNGDSFIFFTDYHLEQSSGYSHLLMQDIVDQTSVDKVVFGGDIFNGSHTHDGAMAKISEYLKRFKPLNVYGVRGNHEYNWYAGGSVDVQLTDSEIYNTLLKGVESNVKTNGGLSCYFDNENQKIRFIIVDSHSEHNSDVIPQTECEWLQERMVELESGWSVIVFTHIIFGMPYAELQAGNVIYCPNGQRIVDAINNIKDEMSASLACVICGHVHYDYSNTDNGYLIITTTCDSKQDGGQWADFDSGAGTIIEHAFDVFSVDTQNRTIKAVRVGRGEDREWEY